MRTFSKSDFKLARDCEAKLTWRERRFPTTQDDNPYLALLAEGGYMVEQLARLGFPEGRELHYDRADPVGSWDATRAALAGDGTWFEATLLGGRQLARVDILRRRGNHFDLFEVKSKSFEDDDIDSTAPSPFRSKRKPHGILAKWRPYLEDVTYQVHVLRKLYPQCTVTPHLILVDKARTTTVDGMPRLFEIRRGIEKDLDVRFVGDPAAIDAWELLAAVNVQSEVDELFDEVGTFADAQEQRYNDTDVLHAPVELRHRCRACEFRDSDPSQSGFHQCWGKLAPAGPSILDLYKFGATKFDGEPLADVMIRNGRVGLDEVDHSLLVKTDGSATAASVRQLVQIRHTLANESWYGDGLASALEQLSYPLHFIDFETSGLALPYHAGMRPYQTIGFQWSCHTIAEPGAEPVHREWINTTDLWPSLEFAETLRAAIGDTGSVLIWSKHERTIMRHIHEQATARGLGTPDLLAWVENLGDKNASPSRLVDLNALCVEAFFHPGMAGRTSIKWVLDALWSTDPVLRERFKQWMGDDAYDVADDTGPYECLPTIEIDGTELDVADGTGAMRAYQAMLYGAERNDPAIRDAWKDLLRRYCKLDTLAMVLIWDHWRRATASR